MQDESAKVNYDENSRKFENEQSVELRIWEKEEV